MGSRWWGAPMSSSRACTRPALELRARPYKRIRSRVPIGGWLFFFSMNVSMTAGNDHDSAPENADSVASPHAASSIVAGVTEAVLPLLSAHGLSLVDVVWCRERGGWTLRVCIERPGGNPDAPGAQGGITLQDCTRVSRELSAALDVSDLIKHHFSLEVSSPGLDRPLRELADYRRHLGRVAKVKLTAPAPDGQMVLRGPIETPSTSDAVAICVDGKTIEVPHAHVKEARLVFELPAQPKKGSQKRQKNHKGNARA